MKLHTLIKAFYHYLSIMLVLIRILKYSGNRVNNFLLTNLLKERGGNNVIGENYRSDFLTTFISNLS